MYEHVFGIGTHIAAWGGWVNESYARCRSRAATPLRFLERKGVSHEREQL